MSAKGEKTAVIQPNSGLCDQISFLSLGMRLAECGYRCYYNLDWYSRWGKDNDRQPTRSWQIPAAFPGIRLEYIDKVDGDLAEVSGCKVFDEPLPDRFVTGTYRPMRKHMLQDLPVLRREFRPVLSDAEREIAEAIGEHTCAIHVRRGDLANGWSNLGPAASMDYFGKAVRIVKGLDPDVKFMVFSDDPEYVKKEMIPRFPPAEYRMMDDNDVHHAYIDLYYMSRAGYIIGSLGSFAMVAAMLSPSAPVLVVSVNRECVSDIVPNVIYVNDDYGRRCDHDFRKDCTPRRIRDGFVNRIVYRLWKHFGKRLNRESDWTVYR